MLLVAFALLAGAGTAVSPCVLPILPAVLSASASGGARRPLGVVLGLTATFALTVAGVAELVVGTGAGQTALRDAAVAVVALAGAALLVPGVAHRVERLLAPASRMGPRSAGRGFWSGLGVGAALGLLYVPCAGPILAAVISVGAASSATIPIALGYATGTAVVLLALGHGGRRLAGRLRGPAVRRALGAVLVATAVVLATNADQRFEATLAAHLPSVLVDPTGRLERSHAVQQRLAALGHAPRFKPMAVRSRLPDLGPAPDFRGTQRWFNSRPLSLAQLRGKVVLVDFWTYTCINCLRTLPYLKAWYARYGADGFVVVGVHTPEFGFEHDAGNVRAAVARFGIRYPVVQDNDYATWNAWRNQAWPSEYLIDARGHVREAREGEGDYAATERSIRTLLADAGARRLGARARVGHAVAPGPVETPETYLGVARAEGWVEGPHPGLRTYAGAYAPGLPLNRFAYKGTWRIGDQAALAVRDAEIDAHVVGRAVYLVLGSAGGRPRPVTVLLDGKPIPPRLAGADVHGARIVVRRQRLYSVADFGAARDHVLTLRFAPGVSGYSFTFG